MKGFSQTLWAFAAATSGGLLLALLLPLGPLVRDGALVGVLVSAAAGLPALWLKQRALARPAEGVKAMAAGVKAVAAGLVLRVLVLVPALYVSVKLGLSGFAFALGFFGVYLAVQAAEAYGLLSGSQGAT